MQKSSLDEAAEYCRHKLINTDSDLESKDNKSTNEKNVESEEENKSEIYHAAVYFLGVFTNTIQKIVGGITLGLAHIAHIINSVCLFTYFSF